MVATLAATLCDTQFEHKVAETMGAHEDVCMVLDIQLPHLFISGGHTVSG